DRGAPVEAVRRPAHVERLGRVCHVVEQICEDERTGRVRSDSRLRAEKVAIAALERTGGRLLARGEDRRRPGLAGIGRADERHWLGPKGEFPLARLAEVHVSV